MSHLSPERLAALADDPPTAAELAHLTGCADCTRERAAHRALGRLAAGSARSIGAPLTTWESLRPALLADGVIDSGDGLVSHPRPRRFGWFEAAAAAVLVAGGAVAGRLSDGVSFSTAATPFSTGRVALVDSTPRFKTLDEARAAQTQSQMLYQNATAYLAQHDTTSRGESPSAMRTRLAALDRTQQVLNQALTEAPYDPIINGYYLTTVGQREATLRMINTAAPASMRITSY
jgi:hypothetical protein